MTMNSQEVFDTVAKHLMKQGRRAYDDAEMACRYRAPNGDMCAVGCLIPDDLYNEAGMEGLPASDLMYDFPKLRSRFDDSVPYRLFDDLQSVHDEEMMDWDEDTDEEVPSMSTWANAMRRVATKYGLSYAVLDGYEG